MVDQLQIQQLVHHQYLEKNVVMLSDGNQLQQQQVHHQYLQIKTFMLSDKKQLQQQQQQCVPPSTEESEETPDYAGHAI